MKYFIAGLLLAITFGALAQSKLVEDFVKVGDNLVGNVKGGGTTIVNSYSGFPSYILARVQSTHVVGSGTPISYLTEEFDGKDEWDGTTFNPKDSGIYVISATACWVNWPSVATNYHAIEIDHSSGNYNVAQNHAFGGDGVADSCLSTSVTWPVYVGQTIQIKSHDNFANPSVYNGQVSIIKMYSL